MSADLNNDGATSDAGAVYILYGVAQFSSTYQLNGAGVNVTIIGKGASDYLGQTLRSAGVDLTLLGGGSIDRFGRGISGLGDINNDGFHDFGIGAFTNDNRGPQRHYHRHHRGAGSIGSVGH